MNIAGITPCVVDKHGPGYTKEQVDEMCKRFIISGDYFYKKAKRMNIDAEKAIEITDDVEKRFSQTLDRFVATEKKFANESKKASGSIRDAANKLSDGLSRIEKAANFDRLERYVELLERAANAMNALAELDESGKLSKIADAIK